MADFYLDNDVPVAFALELQVLGHTVVTARDLRLLNAGDEVHLLNAAQQGRIFASHNKKDFELLHAAWLYWTSVWQIGLEHAGILIVRQQKLLAPQMAREIDSLITMPNGRLANQLFDWGPTTGWRRYPY